MTNKPSTPAGQQPHTCVAELTLACTRSCRHCASGCSQAPSADLPVALWQRTVFELKDLGCQRLILSGGEALLYPGWRDIAKTAGSVGLPCGLISSGDLVDLRTAWELKRLAPAGVALSLDGFKEQHDAIRGDGSYKNVLAAAENLRSCGVPLALITTVHKNNVAVLPKMAALIAAIGARAWQVQLAMPAGHMNDSAMTPDGDTILAAGAAVAAARSSLVGIEVLAGDCFAVDPSGRLRGAEFAGCQAGVQAVGISHKGEVLPCLSIRDKNFHCGGLTTTSLKHLWDNSPVLTKLRARGGSTDGRCQRCHHNDSCRGGCLSSALSHSGEPFIGASCYQHELKIAA